MLSWKSLRDKSEAKSNVLHAAYLLFRCSACICLACHEWRRLCLTAKHHQQTHGLECLILNSLLILTRHLRQTVNTCLHILWLCCSYICNIQRCHRRIYAAAIGFGFRRPEGGFHQFIAPNILLFLSVSYGNREDVFAATGDQLFLHGKVPHLSKRHLF